MGRQFKSFICPNLRDPTEGQEDPPAEVAIVGRVVRKAAVRRSQVIREPNQMRRIPVIKHFQSGNKKEKIPAPKFEYLIISF
jgi:hypothetical protein